MEPRQITEDFSVAPQITPEDIPAIAAAGFRSIMCNRPDGEEPGQPHEALVAEAARAAGLEIVSVPFSSASMTEADVEAFLRDEPFYRNGLYERVVVERYRFGGRPGQLV